MNTGKANVMSTPEIWLHEVESKSEKPLGKEQNGKRPEFKTESTV